MLRKVKNFPPAHLQAVKRPPFVVPVKYRDVALLKLTQKVIYSGYDLRYG